MTIGERIKLERKATKLTQAQLAELCGFSAITIRQYEGNKRQPRIEQLRTIAEALNVPVSYLLEDIPADTATENKHIGQLESAFFKLNDEGQRIAVQRVEELTYVPKYQQSQEDGAEPPAPDGEAEALSSENGSAE
ncbi:MAG: helix-turn-helix domain-containing protein [Lachnospiraceae bacterium]|nr:helix-turn-helix domain-containing protein [Lachnospiraceae bacterium]